MNILSKAKALSQLVLNPHLITGFTKYLFIFSHMRSRSSVLSHILGSNSEITGYTELHIPYESKTDLIKMRTLLHQDSNAKLNNQYLLDKILHDKFPFSDQIFRVANPKIIFLLREPKPTLKSMLNMASETGIEYYSTVEEALDYYCSRLLTLKTLAREFQGSYFYIESEELVKNTDEVLYKLTEWLQLSQDLSKHYEIFEKTGAPGFGDPLDNIKSGVLKETPKLSNIKIPAEILNEAELAYDKCKRTLLYYTAPDLTCCSDDYWENVFVSGNSEATLQV
jgi:hypothetical protein